MRDDYFPLSERTLGTTIGIPSKQTIYDKATKFSGVILEVLSQGTAISGGHLDLIKKLNPELEKTNSYREVRVRIPKLHSHIPIEEIRSHDCICICPDSSLIKVGQYVEVTFEDSAETSRGYILNLGGTGGGTSGREGDGEGEEGETDFSQYFNPDDKRVAPPDQRPIRSAKNADTPFRYWVDTLGGFGNQLGGLRELIIEDARRIAQAAGWYYGAVDTSKVLVKSGVRGGDASPQHKSGNAIDFLIEIDGQRLTRAEMYAFMVALVDGGVAGLSGKRLGFYDSEPPNGDYSFYTGCPTHYDLKNLAIQGTAGAQRWFHQYKSPKGVGDPLNKTRSAGGLGEYKIDNIDDKTELGIPKIIRIRIRQMIKGFTAAKGFGATLPITDEIQKRKDQWTNSLQKKNLEKAIYDLKTPPTLSVAYVPTDTPEFNNQFEEARKIWSAIWMFNDNNAPDWGGTTDGLNLWKIKQKDMNGDTVPKYAPSDAPYPTRFSVIPQTDKPGVTKEQQEKWIKYYKDRN